MPLGAKVYLVGWLDRLDLEQSCHLGGFVVYLFTFYIVRKEVEEFCRLFIAQVLKEIEVSYQLSWHSAEGN